MALTCAATSGASQPAPKKPVAGANQASPRRFVRSTSDQAGGWTEPKSLPDSSDMLKWQRPRQVRMAEIHRPRPSYLRSPVRAAALRPTEPSGTRLDVTKADHQQAIGAAHKVPVFAADDTDVRLVAGQVPIENQDELGIFDDVLDDILNQQDEAIQREAQTELPDGEQSPTPADPLTDDDFALPNELPGGDADGELPAFGDGDAEITDETDESIGNVLEDDTYSNGSVPAPDDQLVLPELEGSTDPPRAIPPLDSTPLDNGDGLEFNPPTDEELRIYNGRNCPAEEKTFQQAWEEMRRTPLSSISLDITPSIQPTASAEQVNEVLTRNMALAPSREWRDRDGRLLAEGKMVNYRNGVVDVETTRGTLEAISWYALSNADLCFVSAWWELPSEFSAATKPYEPRNWTMSTFTWTASALCHKPLYFEDVQLERYGHSAGPMKQAALSGVHFFGNIFFLPYHMGVTPPNECQYALGYYRPGSCAPWLLPAVPLSARGARWQLAALIGGLVIFP